MEHCPEQEKRRRSDRVSSGRIEKLVQAMCGTYRGMGA